jgi:hypothetical protein
VGSGKGTLAPIQAGQFVWSDRAYAVVSYDMIGGTVLSFLLVDNVIVLFLLSGMLFAVAIFRYGAFHATKDEGRTGGRRPSSKAQCSIRFLERRAERYEPVFS